MDPTTSSPTEDGDAVLPPLSALSWARVLLFGKQHGVVAALVLITIYQVGLIAQAQQYVCGV
jgi:hypothetical protein